MSSQAAKTGQGSAQDDPCRTEDEAAVGWEREAEGRVERTGGFRIEVDLDAAQHSAAVRAGAYVQTGQVQVEQRDPTRGEVDLGGVDLAGGDVDVESADLQVRMAADEPDPAGVSDVAGAGIQVGRVFGDREGVGNLQPVLQRDA